jgi:integrator complex subunit 1
LLKQQQEKEAAKELEGKCGAAKLHRLVGEEAHNSLRPIATRRKKELLRDLQKAIILWDPDGPARKPPREAVDLLLSVEEQFCLSNIFQRLAQPDFLLMTVGQTTRGAIERAYDWLIPIVSAIPDTIARLPSSASCFLLLRAYGTEGDERKQLKELSTPLLQHVQNSLKGNHGETNAVKAFDLLMTDVASKKPDRRRCARRVLHDALIEFKSSSGAQSWMMSILQLDHAQALLNEAVKYMVRTSVLIIFRSSFTLTFHVLLYSQSRLDLNEEVSFARLFLRWNSTFYSLSSVACPWNFNFLIFSYS